jgi:hypothetical protein
MILTRALYDVNSAMEIATAMITKQAERGPKTLLLGATPPKQQTSDWY